MRGFLLMIVFMYLILPASALEIEAPSVPESGQSWMPDNTDSFLDGILELMEKSISLLYPELRNASRTGIGILASVLLVSMLAAVSGKENGTLDLCGAAASGMILLKDSSGLISLAATTVRELNHYGKLLFPVMTAAMAAQGGITASTGLYTGTVILDAVISGIVSAVMVPGVYLFLAVSVTYAATGEALLKRIRDGIKSAISWCLKTLLTVFVTYMSITGVVSGTADAAALKATKVTVSTVVPVVGGVLSDAAEAVLVSAGLMKNAAGIYGILAVLAVLLEPFLKIGVQYLTWKLVSVLCCVISEGRIAALVEDASAAMGLLLAMTGSVCVLLMISTVCFMKGVG